MKTPDVARCLFLATLLLGATYGAAAQSANDSSAGRRVDFTLTPFEDTLFAAVDGALRARFDDDGLVWYTTESGLVHVDPANATRDLYTKVEGLPSSYSMGLDVEGPRVYVGTDLGLAVLERATGEITAITPENSQLPDAIVQDVAFIGGDVWMGTRFGGVAVWNASKAPQDPGAWTLKNTSTTADHAKPVRRIVESPTAVWVATEGDGLWRYDRASKTWNVTVKADGLPVNEVTSVAERGSAVWVGTPRGLSVRDAPGASWRTYNKTMHGMPDDRVTDVDVLLTANGTLDVFASTRRGVWQLEPESGRNRTHAQDFGILGANVLDNHLDPEHGWLFATTRGVSLRNGNQWRYFATGPTIGPTWGPISFGFTSASVGDGRGFLWFGSAIGLSTYRLPAGGNQGYWQNFGSWQNYPGSVVNWIDTDGNTTWFGTNQGTFGFEHETGRWIPKLATNSRNLVYGLEADRGELWIGLFGDGLRMENLTTGITRTWDAQSLPEPLPDLYITDVRADGNTIWLGSALGVIKLDRLTGTIRSTITKNDGLPGNGVVFRLEPDGPVVWVGTSDGGVARLDVASGEVTRVWNASNTQGFPGGQIRSLHREGDRLWVGTSEGLARIDVNSGAVRTWNQQTSGLVQNFVNGITSAQGLLYLATLSGVQRMEIATSEFLPLHDGPGVVRGSGEDTATTPTRVSVQIDAPRDRSAVTGATQIRGSAIAFGGRIDRVEVKLGDAPFAPATGTESWSFEWNADDHEANAPITVVVRAFSGALSGQSQVLLTPVAAPTIPLRVEEIAPGDAFANRPLRIAARAEGDEPLTASVFYRAPGSASFARLDMTRTGGLFTASIPARDMREGDLRYYIEAQSGLLTATAAGDAASPTTIAVAPAPRLAVAVEGPPLVEATAGTELRFPLNVTNAGTEPAIFRVAASGLRAAWVSVPPDDLELAPGETREIHVRLLVPPAAFADNTTLTFQASDATGTADPASASVPLRIHAGAATPTRPTDAQGGGPIPFAPVSLALALVLVLALVRRRR